MSSIVKQPRHADGAAVERTQGGVVFQPRIDIVETADELTLFGDLPGVTSENLNVKFENRELVIEAKIDPAPDGRNLLVQEYEVGDYYRVFTIGEEIDTDKISAELHDGVLVLHLPKNEAAKPKRIEVKTG